MLLLLKNTKRTKFTYFRQYNVNDFVVYLHPILEKYEKDYKKISLTKTINLS